MIPIHTQQILYRGKSMREEGWLWEKWVNERNFLLEQLQLQTPTFDSQYIGSQMQ